MQDFSIEHEQVRGDIDFIKIAGFLDAHTFEKFEETINDIFTQARFKIIIDLADVEYVSSAGVGVLMGARTEADENGGRIVLLNPAGSVVDVLDALGLSAIFTVAADRREAMAALQAEGT